MNMVADSLDTRVVQSIISANDAGKKLVSFLADRFSYHTPEVWATNISSGLLEVNGKVEPADYILQQNDVVAYLISHIPEPEVDATYTLLYEDEYLMAIDKSGDLPCHPAGSFYKNTLWFLLKKVYGKIHIINRLDRETSGVMLVAKDAKTAGLLANIMATMQKEYMALVYGNFANTIQADGFLIKDVDSEVRKKRRFVFSANDDSDAQSCSTLLNPEAVGKNYSLVKATPETGRLHQIRATLCSLGYPLLGDKLYGIDDLNYLKMRDDLITADDWSKLVLPRQALHATSLTFTHPHLQTTLRIEAPLPAMFAELIASERF